jgi:hypothetical protein
MFSSNPVETQPMEKATGHKIINGPIHEPPFDERDLTEQMPPVKTRFLESAHKSCYFADI